jgi:hypothetical protein
MFTGLYVVWEPRVLGGTPDIISKTKKPHKQYVYRALCGVGGNRTPDTRIFSPLLYQLSYRTIISVLCSTPETIKIFDFAFVSRTLEI